MMKKMLGIACFSVLAAAPVIAQDVKGSADHPLIPRYEGSEIRGFKTSAFEEYRLIISKILKRNGESEGDTFTRLEGKVSHRLYRAPKDRSVLEVFRNYEGALQKAGFTAVFACQQKDCGQWFNGAMNPSARYNGLIYGGQQRYLAAKLARPEGDVYVSLYATSFEPENRTFVQLDVIELKGMEQKMVVVEATEMEKTIARDGRIAIYGILFDFDKADIKPESKEQIDQLGALLKKSPNLQVIIVGHTDGKGAFDYNLSLSQRRAQAVVSALNSGHGIKSSRLTAAGAGMIAPVASNRTDEGRAKNRRVEIVERYVGE
jgi:outer membrane protein OmpA-like peptidoglycan-associated protein